MRIIRCKDGLCFGVKNAVRTALEQVGTDVSVLGELVHNERVKSQLESQGIFSVKLLAR